MYACTLHVHIQVCMYIKYKKVPGCTHKYKCTSVYKLAVFLNTVKPTSWQAPSQWHHTKFSSSSCLTVISSFFSKLWWKAWALFFDIVNRVLRNCQSTCWIAISQTAISWHFHHNGYWSLRGTVNCLCELSFHFHFFSYDKPFHLFVLGYHCNGKADRVLAIRAAARTTII